MPDKWFGILYLFDHVKKLKRAKKESDNEICFTKKYLTLTT